MWVGPKPSDKCPYKRQTEETDLAEEEAVW